MRGRAPPDDPRQASAELLGSGEVDIRRNARLKPPDHYGRTLARVVINGEDVACILIEDAYARPWTAHREDRSDVAEAILLRCQLLNGTPRRTLGLFNWPRL